MSDKFRAYLTESAIGKTILNQIRTIDRMALMAWGAKDFVTTAEGVYFDVRGSKFRGRVVIALDKKRDLYNIEFGQIRKMQWIVKKIMKGVFVEDLVKVIDDFIG
jgi:hypothetical protein